MFVTTTTTGYRGNDTGYNRKESYQNHTLDQDIYHGQRYGQGHMPNQGQFKGQYERRKQGKNYDNRTYRNRAYYHGYPSEYNLNKSSRYQADNNVNNNF